jgi:periplasmic copper chaperone A
MIRAAIVFAVLAILGPAAAAAAGAAEPVRVRHIEVSGPWVRATLGTVTVTAGYMVLRTTDGGPDRLVGAATPAAERVEIHAHVMEGGVAHMRPVPGIDLDAGRPAALEPGGFHLMLMGVKAPLAEGATVRLTLSFARAGAIDVDVPVRRQAP